MKRPFTSEEFKTIYSKVPRLCVDLVIKTRKGIILTLRSLPTWYGMWHLPGGTILYKESLQDAIKRVAEEELGITAPVQFYKKFLFAYTDETEMEALYIAKSNGPFHPNQTEVEKVKFFSKDELRRNHSTGKLKLTELTEHIFKLVGYL